MPIRAQCPNCDKRYMVKDELAEKSLRCGQCNHRFKLPKQPTDQDSSHERNEDSTSVDMHGNRSIPAKNPLTRSQISELAPEGKLPEGVGARFLCPACNNTISVRTVNDCQQGLTKTMTCPTCSASYLPSAIVKLIGEIIVSCPHCKNWKAVFAEQKRQVPSLCTHCNGCVRIEALTVLAGELILPPVEDRDIIGAAEDSESVRVEIKCEQVTHTSQTGLGTQTRGSSTLKFFFFYSLYQPHEGMLQAEVRCTCCGKTLKIRLDSYLQARARAKRKAILGLAGVVTLFLFIVSCALLSDTIGSAAGLVALTIAAGLGISVWSIWGLFQLQFLSNNRLQSIQLRECFALYDSEQESDILQDATIFGTTIWLNISHSILRAESQGNAVSEPPTQ